MIDTHVHIFKRNAIFAKDSRYTPDYDALPQDLYENMRANGIHHAVLVQPSFLGFDNSYILEAIAAHPLRFSGIAVVEPTIDLASLADLKDKGIKGVRLNCIGKLTPDFSGEYKNLVTQLASLNMVLQIQAEGKQWGEMESFLASAPLRIIIDHFGRTPIDDKSGGFQNLLRAAHNENLWFKFSAPYRMGDENADLCAKALLETIGIERIIWGSDFPNTQFEQKYSYADTFLWLNRWVASKHDREKILMQNPLSCLRLA